MAEFLEVVLDRIAGVVSSRAVWAKSFTVWMLV